MERVEVGAYILEGGEILRTLVCVWNGKLLAGETTHLCHGCTSPEDCALGAARLSGHLGLGIPFFCACG